MQNKIYNQKIVWSCNEINLHLFYQKHCEQTGCISFEQTDMAISNILLNNKLWNNTGRRGGEEGYNLLDTVLSPPMDRQGNENNPTACVPFARA